jgi:eukaryotic-like serine/threonine-protein kinase
MTDLTEPTRIHGRYLLQERLASGGSADVWRARDEHLDREVAVKLLHPHLLSDETSRLRLGAEGRVAASLSHPGIVAVYDVEPAGDTPALVMQLIDGESLNTRLAREGALPARDAASIGADVAEALDYAHARGIVHRDVKPSNILIGSDGHARLADFGIAHSLAPAAERLTATGTVIGTMRYISPEQLNGGDIGPRTDLYGLGAVLFEMLTGRPPFDALSPLAQAEAQAAGPPEMPGIDPALAQVTRDCLSVDVENRPPNAGVVAGSLRGWLAADATGGDAVPALPVYAGAASDGTASDAAASDAADDAVTQPIALVVPPPAAPAPGPTAPPRRGGLSIAWLRRMRPIAVAVAGVLLAALLIIAITGSGTPAGGGTPPSATPVPAWMSQLQADYAAACGGSLDTATLGGLSQQDAQDQVASLIDACSSPAPTKGKGHGHGRGPG